MQGVERAVMSYERIRRSRCSEAVEALKKAGMVLKKTEQTLGAHEWDVNSQVWTTVLG